MPKRKIVKQIAPRLVGGGSRARVANAWPPSVKDGIALIAAAKRMSANWLVEQAVLEKFGVQLKRIGAERPEYVRPTTQKDNIVPMRRKA